MRYSPDWPSTPRPPWSATVTGSSAPDGCSVPARIVPPFSGVPVCGGSLRSRSSFETPHAEAMSPSSGTDMPTVAPRRMNSRRPIFPARSSSIRWFSSGVRCARTSSSRRLRSPIRSLAARHCPARDPPVRRCGAPYSRDGRNGNDGCCAPNAGRGVAHRLHSAAHGARSHHPARCPGAGRLRARRRRRERREGRGDAGAGALGGRGARRLPRAEPDGLHDESQRRRRGARRRRRRARRARRRRRRDGRRGRLRRGRPAAHLRQRRVPAGRRGAPRAPQALPAHLRHLGGAQALHAGRRDPRLRHAVGLRRR